MTVYVACAESDTLNHVWWVRIPLALSAYGGTHTLERANPRHQVQWAYVYEI
jgi:hypothetical protein